MLHPVLESFVTAQKILGEHVEVGAHHVKIKTKHTDVIISRTIVISEEQLMLYISKDYYGYFREVLKEYNKVRIVEAAPSRGSVKHRVQLIIEDTPEKLIEFYGDIDYMIEKIKQMKADFDKKFYKR